jgi:uncharacterized protein
VPGTEGLRRFRFKLEGRLAATARRGASRELSLREDQSLRHAAELIGIPACEIGAAKADGESWPLELAPPDDSLVELSPVPEPILFAERPSFLADLHLGRLSRELRLLGFDSLWRGSLSRDEAIEVALGEGRVLLSADRSLLFRRELARAKGDEVRRRCMLVLSKGPFGQLLEVCARFGLAGLWRPLSLCSDCGGELREADAAEVRPLVPPVVAEKYVAFRICPACGKVFWRGDQARSIEPLLEGLRAAILLSGDDDRGVQEDT